MCTRLEELTGEGQTLGTRRAWQVNNNGRRYFRFAGANSEFIGLAKSGAEIHEVIQAKKPMRFFMDIDIDKVKYAPALEMANRARDADDMEPINFDDLTRLLLIHVDIIMTELTEQNNHNKYVLGYETDAKCSRHVIFRDAIASCGYENKQINNYIADTVAKNTNGIFHNIFESEICRASIDAIGNTKNYMFLRFPGCGKGGDNMRTFMALTNGASRYDIDSLINVKYPTFESYEISAPTATPNIMWDITNNGEHIDGRVVSSNNTASDLSNFSESERAECAELFDQLKTLYPCYTVTFGNAGAFYGVKIARNAASYCHCCERVHQSMGAFVVKTDKIRVCCFAAKRGMKNKLSTHLKCIVRSHPKFKPSAVLADKFTPAPEDAINSIIAPHVVVEGGDCDKVIKDDNTSSYIISSPWGTGKSNFIARAVEDAKNNNTPIIAISSRKSLSIQQYSAWGLTNYSTITGRHSIAEHPFTNWQIESLHRVDKSAASALIIIDETTALAEQCRTGYKGRQGLHILGLLLSSCKRYIIADNNINEYIVRAATKAAPNIAPIIVKNNTFRFANARAEVFEGKNAHVIGKAEIIADVRANAAALIAGRQFKTTVVSCHSKRDVNELIAQMHAEFPDHKDYFISYTAETGDDVKINDFSDATVAWANKLAIIYSPTVSIGISCLADNIGTVYALHVDDNAPAEQSAQAIFRCRKLTNIRVFFRDSYSTAKLPSNEEEFLNYVTRNDYNDIAHDVVGHSSYNAMYRDITDVNELGNHLNNFVGLLYTSATLQAYRSKNAFAAELAAIFRRAGITTQITELRKLTEDDKDIINQSKESAKYLRESSAQRIDEMKAAYKKLGDSVDNQKIDKTKTEKLAERVSYLRELVRTLDVETTLEAADKYSEEMENCARFHTYIGMLNEKTNTHSKIGDYYDHVVSSDAERFKLIYSIMEDVKTGPKHGELLNESELFDKYGESIISKGLRLFGNRNMRRICESKARIRGVLNVALKYIGSVIKNDSSKRPIISNIWI